MGIVASQLFAQPPETDPGNRTYKWVEQIVENDYNLSIVCDGAEVDVLNFVVPFDIRLMSHIKNGQETWIKFKANNIKFVSKITQEVFNGQTTEIQFQKGQYLWALHLNGNMGHHYNIKMVFETVYWDLIYYHSSCN